jgi:hypothetical protein
MQPMGDTVYAPPMKTRIRAGVGAVGIAMLMAGCAGGSTTAPTSPSPLATPPTTPPTAGPTSNPGPGVWLGGTYQLAPVSLSGLVFEQTPSGRVGVAGAAVYCEVCGAATHSWAIADANGFYRFSSDLASGGGVWLKPGALTIVGVEREGYQDPPGIPLMFNGSSGWRQVSVEGDTQFDIQLVRR